MRKRTEQQLQLFPHAVADVNTHRAVANRYPRELYVRCSLCRSRPLNPDCPRCASGERKGDERRPTAAAAHREFMAAVADAARYWDGQRAADEVRIAEVRRKRGDRASFELRS